MNTNGTQRKSTRRRVTSVALALGLATAACGGGDAGVDVSEPWSRATAEGATAGAVYMELESDETDALVGVSVDPAIAAVVEIHETVMVESPEDDMSDDEMSDDGDHGMDGAMTMQEVSEIPIAAGEAVALAPGGLHVMLLDLAAPLVDGETFELTLEFANAEPQVVEVTVRDEAP